MPFRGDWIPAKGFVINRFGEFVQEVWMLDHGLGCFRSGCLRVKDFDNQSLHLTPLRSAGEFHDNNPPHFYNHFSDGKSCLVCIQSMEIMTGTLIHQHLRAALRGATKNRQEIEEHAYPVESGANI